MRTVRRSGARTQARPRPAICLTDRLTMVAALLNAPETPRSISCPGCDAIFRADSDLEAHRVAVHGYRSRKSRARRQASASLDELIALSPFTEDEKEELWSGLQTAAQGAAQPSLRVLHTLWPRDLATRKSSPPWTLKTVVREGHGRYDDDDDVPGVPPAARVPSSPRLPERQDEPAVSYRLQQMPVRVSDHIKHPRADAVLMLHEIVEYAERHRCLDALGRLRRCRRCRVFYVEEGNLRRGRYCGACRGPAKCEAARQRMRELRSRAER